MIFGSDNQAGASEPVLAALTDAYRGTADAYGTDEYVQAATDKLKEVFETDLEAFFVVSGTASNTLALSTMVQPWDGIICHHQAHIYLDESSAPALLTGGAGMLPVPSKGLRIDAEGLTTMLERIPNDPPHNLRPRALSITQANECGQVYSVAEVSELSKIAKGAKLKVHMDGARFANAVAALDCLPAEVTWQAGVDVLSLGATKNGAVAAEAIVFFDRSLAKDFAYRLKRSGHLTSKARMFGAQFVAWLEDEHWLDLAQSANARAQQLRAGIAKSSGMRLAFPTQSNETFAIVSKDLYQGLLASGVSLFDWYADALPPEIHIEDSEQLVRLVTSWATSSDEVSNLLVACERLSTGSAP